MEISKPTFSSTDSGANGFVANAVKTPFEAAVQHFYNAEPFDDDWKQTEFDGYLHTHYGIGEYDHSILDISDPVLKKQKTIKELLRMEDAEAQYVIDHFGKILPEDRLLDAGCGRGGTSIMAALQFGCSIDGVNISDVQLEQANRHAKKLGLNERVKFHFRNMLATGLENESVQVVWNNESTIFVDIFELFKENARVLKQGGRYVCLTFAYTGPSKSAAVKEIDKFYGCNFHHLSTYFKALAANALTPIKVEDLTTTALPYFEFRQKTEFANGVEKLFLEAYRGGDFRYILIVADKLRA